MVKCLNIGKNIGIPIYRSISICLPSCFRCLFAIVFSVFVCRSVFGVCLPSCFRCLFAVVFSVFVCRSVFGVCLP